MTVLFIHPPLDFEVSGGNVFNRQIISEARATGYRLISFTARGACNTARFRDEIARTQARMVVWDTLLLDCLADFFAESSQSRHALLVHYLPSLEPGLDPALVAQKEFREKLAIEGCDRLIVTGLSMLHILSKRYPDKAIFLCRPGVDEYFCARSEVRRSTSNSVNVELISVANLLPAKGFLDLLAALAHLKEFPWTWHIAGSERVDGAFCESFKQSAAKFGLLSRIRFHGLLRQEKLALLLREMDLFVQASHQESYGMALAEALALGLPVVATRTGGAAEWIVDRENGLLVPVAEPGALRQALQEVLTKPELCAAFREKNRQPPIIPWPYSFEQFKRACDFAL